MTPFHLAIPVHDIELTMSFYLNTLGCTEGRSDNLWVDFNFLGHQLVCHFDKNEPRTLHSIPVDNQDVPILHFGVVQNMPDCEQLAAKLVDLKINFIIQPYIRFKDLPGEQAIIFFTEPCGNAIETKAFQNMKTQLFPC